MRIIAIVNQKGGCGKTTTAINIAGIFAARGHRTLLVDMDPQSHCAAGLAIPDQRIDLTIGDAMLAAGRHPIDASRLLWRISRNLDLATSTMRLATLEAARGELASLPDAELRLSKALDAFRPEYEFCLIDCSPAIGMLTFNALAAATEVIVPVETGFFALQGALKQVNTIKSLAKRLGAPPNYRILATLHDPTSVLSRDVLDELRKRFPGRVFPTVIRHDQSLREAASFGLPVVEYAAESAGAADYGALATHLITERFEAETDPIAGTSDADRLEVVIPERPAQQIQAAVASSSTFSGLVAGVVSIPATNGAAELAAAAGPTTKPAPMSAGHSESIAGLAERLRKAAPAAHTNPSVARVFGVRSTRQGVLFVQPASLGTEVFVAGEFNNWSKNAHPLRRNTALGVLETCIPLPPGKHRYRLLVDGCWIADPYNPIMTPDPTGDLNSVALVPLENVPTPIQEDPHVFNTQPGA